MASGAEQSIASLRRSHNEMVALVEGLEGSDLDRPSAASEWTIAQVLSHLGSAAQIGLNTLITGQADMSAAQGVWDRWNAMSPPEQAAGFVSAGEALVEGFEALDASELATKRVDVGFLPEPIDIEFLVGMRLTEVGLHWWDIDVAFDPGSTVTDYLVPRVLARLPLFAGFFAKPIGMTGGVEVVTSDPVRLYQLDVTDSGATLSEGSEHGSRTRLNLPAESFVRLITGRLGTAHTPGTVVIEGDLSLDDLRRVFPGF